MVFVEIRFPCMYLKEKAIHQINWIEIKTHLLSKIASSV